MAEYLVCLTTNGGVPLFSRSKSGLKQLPFPVIGSLNGVHMFANSHDLTLLSTTTEGSKIIWKVYHDSLTLILIGSNDDSSDGHSDHLLDLIFHGMVLMYGEDDLVNIKNVERFKREIKVCFPLIDALLGFGRNKASVSTVNMAVETMMSSECSILYSYLSTWSSDEGDGSPFAAVLVEGSLCAATPKWWQLAAPELILLNILISHALTPCSARDVAVFLPIKSPKVPHRLLTFELLPGVEICLLCGPKPNLRTLLTALEQYWRPAIDPLRSVARLAPRNLPSSFTLDPNILGLLVVNTFSSRCMCSVDPHPESRLSNKKSMSVDDRRSLLMHFYSYVVGNLWSLPVLDENTQSQVSDIEQQLLHECTDTYICADTHKAYACTKDTFQIFLLYSTQTPTYTMRTLSHKTLDAIIKDKRSTLGPSSAGKQNKE